MERSELVDSGAGDQWFPWVDVNPTNGDRGSSTTTAEDRTGRSTTPPSPREPGLAKTIVSTAPSNPTSRGSSGRESPAARTARRSTATTSISYGRRHGQHGLDGHARPVDIPRASSRSSSTSRRNERWKGQVSVTQKRGALLQRNPEHLGANQHDRERPGQPGLSGCLPCLTTFPTSRGFQIRGGAPIGERSSPWKRGLLRSTLCGPLRHANENQRRVEGVFDALAAAMPTALATSSSDLRTTPFSMCRSTITVMTKSNPIASTAAFTHFQHDHADRRDGGVDQQTAELVGAYITTIDWLT